MRANNVLGILYASSYEYTVQELSGSRTMGSIPFGGRYRVVDFVLSAMVNAGISHVLMPTKSNYRSLMDHIGNGKPWDLARKREGIFMLPPFSSTDSTGVYRNRVEALKGILGFIREAEKEHVLLVDGNLICNPDFGDMLAYHIETSADITIATLRGTPPRLNNTMLLESDSTGRVTGCLVTAGGNTAAELWAPHVLLMKKDLLVEYLESVADAKVVSFERDLVQERLGELNIRAWELPNFLAAIDSLPSYYKANLALLQSGGRRLLFPKERPVYTKVRDEAPSLYGLDASVKNCLIADGCVLNGAAESSLLFRGVRLGKGTVVRNSVIMQDTTIGDGAVLENVILDKRVTVAANTTLSGAANCPYYVPKGSAV
ncbi:MAG: glucose-1-phosphate adenylyltransferase subunit GlgD [Oscillospiraceae bacterium]|jgi:glucose-1-phosphate adenylyltransferase|nr:glucose-1-phosphate adenylyltransferase subunit GlgD [Oscillospiraceae bacterium]